MEHEKSFQVNDTVDRYSEPLLHRHNLLPPKRLREKGKSSTEINGAAEYFAAYEVRVFDQRH